MAIRQTLKRLMVILAVLLPMTASAATFLGDDNVLVTEPVADNLYIGSGNPIVSGDVSGDLFIAGGNVNVSGNIGGDLVAAGGTVTLTGKVAGDVRVFGGSIYIDSEVGGEIISFGGQVIYGPKARIGKDMIAGSDDLQISPAVTVGGKQTLFRGEEKTGDKVVTQAGIHPFLTAAFWIALLLSILAYLIVAAALMGAFPGAIKKYTQSALKDGAAFWVHLGIGLLILVALPIVSIVLMITGLGALLGVILLLVWVVYILVAMVVAGFLLGGLAKDMVTKTKSSLDWPWALGGVVVLPILSSLPVVGWVIGLVFFLWALGTMMSGDLRTFRAVK